MKPELFTSEWLENWTESCVTLNSQQETLIRKLRDEVHDFERDVDSSCSLIINKFKNLLLECEVLAQRALEKKMKGKYIVINF